MMSMVYFVIPELWRPKAKTPSRNTHFASNVERMSCGMKPKSPMQIWWNEICAHRRVYAVGLLAMLLTNGTEAMAPKTLQWMIDALFSLEKDSGSMDIVLRAVFIFFVVAVFGAGGRVLWRMTLARMTHVASKQI
jgi:ABC-type multidrug transport system fused ATPase/permease subunit